MRRRAEPEPEPMPACVARCSSLPFPSLPTGGVDGRGRDPSLLPCRGGPQKGQPAATSVGPPPRLPSVRSRMNGRAALKRRALASAWLPPPGWRAGPARAGCGVGGLLTSGAAGSRTMRDGRLGRRGRSASGESELLRRLGARDSSGGSGGAWDEPATAHPRFCKSALHCFWIPRLFLSPALSDSPSLSISLSPSPDRITSWITAWFTVFIWLFARRKYYFEIVEPLWEII